MNGIEKITARITSDADQEIAQLNEQTRQQVAEILAQAEKEARQQEEEILRRGRQAAQERYERLKGAAGMERRKLELGAKQEVLSDAFELALNKLCELPDKEYIALLSDLAVKASQTGREQVIFSVMDRNRIGKQVVIAANDVLVKEYAPELPGAVTESKMGAFLGKVVNNTAAKLSGTGLLTLSEQTRNTRGGFVMVNEDIETNCTFETLVRMERESMEKQVAQILFE